MATRNSISGDWSHTSKDARFPTSVQWDSLRDRLVFLDAYHKMPCFLQLGGFDFEKHGGSIAFTKQVIRLLQMWIEENTKMGSTRILGGSENASEFVEEAQNQIQDEPHIQNSGSVHSGKNAVDDAGSRAGVTSGIPL